MTNKLKYLIRDWDEEVELHETYRKRFLDSVTNLTSLNKKIYDTCRAEGIDINSLELKGPPSKIVVPSTKTKKPTKK